MSSHNFGGDGIWTKVTELESEYEGNHIKDRNSSGSLNAWFIHLAEGSMSPAERSSIFLLKITFS